MARLNTKKLLGFLISLTVRKDTMLMALRKNPSMPAREEEKISPLSQSAQYQSHGFMPPGSGTVKRQSK